MRLCAAEGVILLCLAVCTCYLSNNVKSSGSGSSQLMPAQEVAGTPGLPLSVALQAYFASSTLETALSTPRAVFRTCFTSGK